MTQNAKLLQSHGIFVKHNFQNSQIHTIALLWQKPTAVLIEDFLCKYSDWAHGQNPTLTESECATEKTFLQNFQPYVLMSVCI